MHYRLTSLSLATATLLLSVTFPRLPLTSHFAPLSAQAQTPQDLKTQTERLNQEGIQQYRQGQFPEALETFQKLLVIVRELHDKTGERATLNNIATVYGSQGQYPKELETLQELLAIVRELKDNASARTILNNIAMVYRNLSQYSKALESYQELLSIVRELGDKAGEGATLNNMAVVSRKLGQYPKALEFFQQALAIMRTLNDKAGEASTLNNIAVVYREQSQYPKALEIFEQALSIHKSLGNKAGEATTLSNIATLYDTLGQYPKALEFFEQALAIYQEVNQQRLASNRELGDKAGEGKTLNDIGEVYQNLGQYSKALEYYQKALLIEKEIDDKAGEKTTLNNIAVVYDRQGQYSKALEFLNQALGIAKAISDKAGERTTLNNIAAVYRNLKQYPQALEFYQQALAIERETDNPAGQEITLAGMGVVYFSQGQYTQALESYQQALVIQKEIGDRAGEGITLGNIGNLLKEQKQPELAIAFYKQSVNITQAIRQDLRVLPKEQQQSYTQTVADTYRSLADLLLKQDRVLEAQKVLDLLKVQEIDDYLRNVRGNNQTATGLPNLSPEEQFNQSYNALINQAITLGKELTQLTGIPEQKRTPAQQQRVIELRNTQQKILAEFNSFIHSPAVETIVQQLSKTANRQNLDLEDLNSLQSNLKKLNQNAVLLYPLILDDRLELVLVTADSPPIHRSVPVKREDLNRAIAQFRTALENPSSDAKTPARQLYDWLIKPIENDLTQANAQTIIYAPDAQLRYIPLATLHDGKQWLVQRFRVNNITARSLKEIDTRPQVKPHILAGAFTKGSYRFKLGNQEFSFNGLPFAAREVENLAAIVPGTTQLLDNAFSRDGTVPRMNDYNIIHLATHAVFVTAQPEDSFVLFGNGDRITLGDIDKWSLPNVDLVVLSACETGLGGFGNGQEILGFGYLMQKTGARTAIASLWSVSDGGTQALMNAFYTALENSNTTKAEALRQAQIALITGDYTALGKQRGLGVQQRISSSLSSKVANRLSHPYYWAPFILIGNGL